MQGMKFLTMLQALSSAQAQRTDLRIYVQIGSSERGNVRTQSDRTL